MTSTRIAGVALFVLLGAGLLIRVMNHSGIPPRNPDPAPVQIRSEGEPLTTETVDLKTENLHLTIPLVASAKRKQ
jgi:hypothetical protein